MSEDTPLIKAETAIEAFALIIARYYETLVRSGVPAELAADLTCKFQEQQLRQQAGRQALASFGQWMQGRAS